METSSELTDLSSDDPLILPIVKPRPTTTFLEKRASNPFEASQEDGEEDENQFKEGESDDETLLMGKSITSPQRKHLNGDFTPLKPVVEQAEEHNKRLLVNIDPVGLDGREDGLNGDYVVADEELLEDGHHTIQPEGLEVNLSTTIGHAEERNGDQALQTVDVDAGNFKGLNEDNDSDEDMEEIPLTLDLSEGSFQPHTSDDEMTFHLKPPDEQLEIQEEIEELLKKMPELARDYQMVDRLGTGTFSSVFKAKDLHYEEWDNRLWEGIHPQSTSVGSSSRIKEPSKHTYVAIKRILVTSSPKRISNEILIMEICRGCRHVAQIITAYRIEDQVVAIMPYQRSVDIRDLIKGLNLEGIREYFRCMFRALRDIHARGIIHRDLKPANFLFDPVSRTGTMVDFGLADIIEWDEEERDSGCVHTGPSLLYPHGKMKTASKWSLLMRKSFKTSREKSNLSSDNVGWPTDDNRPTVKANRAGTRGFRAPEVLFKCTAQSGAVDIWSAGTILLFFLTGKWPIFTATTDMHALLEQALILGKDAMEKCAALHCRTFATNIPEIQQRVSWTTFVKKLNPSIYDLQKSTGSSDEHEDHAAAEERRKHLIQDALDLLNKCLEPISVQRITARDALYHPFLALDQEEIQEAIKGGRDPSQLEDDELFPHPPGQGVCGQHHGQDEDGEWKVRIGLDRDGNEVWEKIEAGEGQAIGSRACSFHSSIL